MKIKLLSLSMLFLFCVGWTSKTHQTIVVQASNLTPYELKLLINKYKTEILAGSIEPLKGTKDENHYLLVDGSYGKVHLRIDAELKTIFQKMRDKTLELPDLCRRLGVISHFIAEVNNPLLTGDLKRESGWLYNNFVKYTDSKLDTFVLTFDGYQSDLLEQGDYQGFIIASAIRSAENFEPLRKTYFVNKDKNLGFEFDEKSIPYAAASLAYNYAVTDTAKMWYYIWQNIHGDMSFAPYDNKNQGSK